LVILAQLHNCEAAENIPVKNEELRKIWGFHDCDY
jgi:hypothetical protein